MANFRVKGRATAGNPRNRFEGVESIPNYDDLSEGDIEDLQRQRTQLIEDKSKTILTENRSPDIPFTYSINPYRGCEHGCIYCYARPMHEYLGYSAGLDFETKIVYKPDAAQLLAKRLNSRSWKPQLICMSSATDCYQPIEKELRLTRSCLEVLANMRQAVGIITKNSLVTRDLDLLQELSQYRAVSVAVSITTLDSELARSMEPRTSSPRQRLQTVRALADAGVPVGVNIAPIIPGLTEHELPEIIKQAAEAGAHWAHYQILRLPYGVKDLFLEWLQREHPSKQERIVARIKAIRDGELNETAFKARFKGEGIWAEAIRDLFKLSVRRAGLNAAPPDLETGHFRMSKQNPRQMELF